MRYLWYGFLGLFSVGFIGAVVAVSAFLYILHYYAQDLPDYTQLRKYEPPIVTRLYAGDGHLLAEFAQEKRVFVPLEFIPEHVKESFIAAEDQNFYRHSGVDVKAVIRAMFTNIKNAGTGRRPEGASTIAQQVAKNFFLTNEVSYIRKIKEAILAYRMYQTLGKDRILELYLNEIYLGGGAYGVAAASLYYFGKSLEKLTIAEVSFLAALPKAPNNYHPVRHHEKALDRRNWVIERMLEENYISPAQAELATLAPLEIREDTAISVDAPYFAEEVRRELSERYGEDSLYKGGLVVKTSVDPSLQELADQSLRNGLMEYDMRHGWRGSLTNFQSMDDWRRQLSEIERPEGMLREWFLAVVLDVSDDQALLGFEDPELQGTIKLDDVKWARKYLDEGYALGPEVTSISNLLKVGDVLMVENKPVNAEQLFLLRQVPIIQGALIALDPHTGRILAMQGGWNYRYGGSEFNRATQADRQPGSAFKPFVYLAALDKGFTPATLVLDAPFVLEDEVSGTWKPTNYSNEFYGPTPIRVGVEKSRNLMTVRLADFLGMDLIAKYSDHFGITEKMQPLLANSLGATETTLLKMTAAYGMLANGGKKITPTFIDRIQDRYGKTIFKHDQRPCENCGDLIKWEEQPVPNVPDVREQIADPRTAYQMVSIMEGVIQRGTAMRLRDLNRPLAGKTGTTNESRDAWFIGFSPNLVVGVYAGYDNPRSLGKKETGSSVAVPIFKNFMEQALSKRPVVPFRKPQGIRNIRINAETGVRARPGDQNVIWESFVIGTEPSDEMYILDGEGISVMSGHYDTTNYTYQSPDGEYTPPASTQPSSITTGTGGLY
ncbi:MAG: PBP1A family penicillin-binding protein [Alphaproteobacteria bacterium]|nr:PBP1A family penicillin-binding protein [Alphaproteobacteria bacterium]